MAGASIGYELESSRCSSGWFCGIAGLVIGGAIGEVVGLPLGVHLANRRRGSYGKALLASLGVVAAGLLVAGLTEEDAGGRDLVLIAIPITQLAVTISIERATGRR